MSHVTHPANQILTSLRLPVCGNPDCSFLCLTFFDFLSLNLNHMCTYVRTEVNYTEEVDDPVDSDGDYFSYLFICLFLSQLPLTFCNSPLWISVYFTGLFFCFFNRRSSGFWKSRLQHFRVCSHSAGKQQVQEHSEEGSAWAHLLHHPVHADHWRPGEAMTTVKSISVDSDWRCGHCCPPQGKVWTANPQQFVEDEDDDTFSYSVRISAQDLLLVRSLLFSFF